jgi:COP9 signalosome complex subunit 8
MANGPPTPPPTTEAEIQDEARQPAESAVPAPPPQPVPSRDDAYWQNILPTIADLASQSNFQEIIHVAENADLNVRFSLWIWGLPRWISSTEVLSYRAMPTATVE